MRHKKLLLLITASVVALVLLWPHVRSGPSEMRLAVEVFVGTLALFALLSGLLVIATHLL